MLQALLWQRHHLMAPLCRPCLRPPQVIESLRRNARDNFLAGLLLSVLNFFLGLVEYATKFATVSELLL